MRLPDYNNTPRAASASSSLKLMHIEGKVCVVDEEGFKVLSSEDSVDEAVGFVSDLVAKWYDGRPCRLHVIGADGKHLDTLRFNDPVE